MTVVRRTIACALLTALLPISAKPAGAAEEAPGLLVDPFVGTLGDFGQLSPAAVAPYGMVQLGPDTAPANHAGYDFAATRLVGFSHTRAVGVGCGGAGGDVRVSLGYDGDPAEQIIDKRREAAHAGHYSVVFGPGIQAQTTATRGAGIIRFSLPKAGTVRIAVDYGRTYSRHLGAEWRVASDGDLRASTAAGTVCDAGTYHIHAASRLMRNGKAVAVEWRRGAQGRAEATLSIARGDVLEMRTGLSSIDPAAAAIVRETELGKRAFAQIARGTLGEWNRELSRIRIAGSRRDRAMLYTSLFRVMQTPVAIADPDGRYRGSDGRLAQVRKGDQHYASWAMWDNYRTQMPLIALLDPDRAGAIARSLVRLYQTGKQRWATPTEPFLTVRTEHAGIALLDFRRKGIAGFDAHAALAGMVAESPSLARATPDEKIEAAYDDWAIAELATDLGDRAVARQHRDLALSYRPMWLETFDRLGADADVVKARGLYQGTLAQYRWAPVFDLPWMRQAMGERFIPELRAFFAENRFNMTNQPDIHAPYLLAWAGDRQASAQIVGRMTGEAVAHRYTNSAVRPVPWIGRSFDLAPQGFADGMDDDAGTMTAWYVWAELGLYPLTPGVPEYVVTAPMAPRIEVRSSSGTRGPATVITRDGTGAAIINGEVWRETTISHSRLIAGER